MKTFNPIAAPIPTAPSSCQRADRRAAADAVGIRLGEQVGLCETLVHGGSLLAGFRPSLVTGRIARPVRSRRSSNFNSYWDIPFTNVADVSFQSRKPNHGRGPLRCTERHLQAALRPGHPRPRSPTDRPRGGHRASNSSMDGSATAKRLSGVRGTPVSIARSRFGLSHVDYPRQDEYSGKCARRRDRRGRTPTWSASSARSDASASITSSW